MRMLVRLTALAVLSVTGLLIVGHGEWLIRSADPGVAPGVLAGGLVVGASLAMIRPLRRGIGQLVTLLHELGHTVVAAALGASPGGIVLRHDTSGHATSRWVGRATPLRRFALAAIAFAGFPAAAAVSAAGARLLLLAGPRAVLWSIAAAGLVVAALARSAWSLLIAGASSVWRSPP